MKICRKLSIDDYKKKVEEYGHTFLGLIKKTKREQQRVSFECGKCKSVSEGNIYHMSTVCGKCKCKKYRISEEKVKDTLLLFNHKFVGFEYYEKGGEYKIVFNCGTCGSKRVSALRDIKTKFCRKCFVLPQRSKNELFLVSLIKQKYPFLDVKESDRDLLEGKSIKGDFFGNRYSFKER